MKPELLKVFREKYSLSINAASALARTKAYNWSKWESGKTIPTESALELICLKLGADPRLLGLSQTEAPSSAPEMVEMSALDELRAEIKKLRDRVTILEQSAQHI